MKRMLGFCLLVIFATVGLWATGGQEEVKDEGPITLRVTVWTGGAAHLEMLNGIASEYKISHPNVNVVYETIPFGDYVTKLSLQLAGSNPPDIGWLLETSAPTFLASGVLQDISGALKADESYDFADFSEPALSLWVDGPEVYGIPFSTSPFLFFYNEDLYREAGVSTPKEMYEAGDWTWENFKTAAKIIKEKTGKFAFQTGDGSGYASGTVHAIVPILRAYGTDIWDENGKVMINSPEAKEAMNMYHNMIFSDKSVVPPGNLSDFFAGDAASTIAQISRIPKLDNATFKWDIAPLPAGPAAQPRVIGQAALAVFQSSQNIKEATDFIAFMTNKENVTTMAKFFPPARKSILESDTFRKANMKLSDENFNFLADGVENGLVLPSHENYPKISLILSGEMDSLWVPDADVTAVLDQVAEAITPLIK